MTNKIAVNYNGRPFKYFNTVEEAGRFMEIFKIELAIRQSQLDYIDQAVDVSDLNEAKEVINHIMEL
jgi:viroplasmin and RNaseH domain-containing protein